MNSKGEAGYFQHHFSVYDREGDDCEACGQKILRVVQAGRATYYCKSCQK
ncbi:MAG: zinc finger domain-containing protein [Rickettsiales bacterium]